MELILPVKLLLVSCSLECAMDVKQVKAVMNLVWNPRQLWHRHINTFSDPLSYDDVEFIKLLVHHACLQDCWALLLEKCFHNVLPNNFHYAALLNFVSRTK